MKCDFFAQSFQSHLDEYRFDYMPLFIAIYPGSFLFNGHMVLHEAGHPFDGHAIGHDTHFATLVIDDKTGDAIVYDNHHPCGITLERFNEVIEFQAEFPGPRSGKNPYTERQVGHDQLVRDDAVRVYEVAARGKLGVGHWRTKIPKGSPQTSFKTFATAIPSQVAALRATAST